MFHRGVAIGTRASCRQRHTIAAAINVVMSSNSNQATATNRCDASNSIIANYHFHGYHPSASVMKAKPLASIDDTNTLSILATYGVHIRTFRTVGDYHDVADETLNNIQDAVEDYLEEYYDAGVVDKEEDIPEVNYASGVLSLYLPPHGTWIINKQTPNQQLWWSSPISGPKRYEYDEERGIWVHSRAVDEGGGTGDLGAVSYGEEDTLGGILNKEIEELFGEGLGDEFHC
eukprot:CAMPEP_0172552758 /NCGR_PEP_ID=MMETSP1067-20121228/47175_1 /TAXON_ID=265564 ORGANISM="Thalassiosira punctigera, Strain Tpunct2005C2" /NCGR_SAMPLE_ID=MMETSP1067 /ASSEMBLY_ACC=CAM_ASM_000444 /LENGTH=230 /DNA_ID=CAMNT_0013340811 /DNA_START=52 /DNA_END=744 /DNA_ORIENTATION=+